MQVHFHFQSQLVASDNTFPRAMQNLISNLPVRELDLAFVHGRWVRSTSACHVSLAEGNQDSSQIMMYACKSCARVKDSLEHFSETVLQISRADLCCSSPTDGVSRRCL